MSNPSTILFITDLFEVMGGAERNLISILRGLDKNRFKPILCCLKSGQLAENMRREGFIVIDLNFKRIYSPLSFSKILYIYKLIRKEQVKLIITYHESSDFLGFALAKIIRIPIISSKRDMGFNLKAHHVCLYKIIGRFFNAVIAVSEKVRRTVIKRDHIPKHKVLTIHNGVDLNKYQAQINIEKKKKVCAIVGLIAGLRKIKGINFFIEAAALVLKEGIEAKFLIIGNDPGEPGSTQKDLDELANELGISKQIDFGGHRTDIPELLAMIDISVISSLSEGFSNTIIESMAAGKPVVATNVGGNPEAVMDGVTGFLVPPADPEAMAMAIKSLIKDKQLAKKMGQAAINRVKEHFTLERMIEANEDLYDYVLEKYKSKTWKQIVQKWLKSRQFILIQTIKLIISVLFYYSGGIKLYLFAKKIFGKSFVKILTYHNISDMAPSYLGLSMPTELFRQQIKYIKENYDVISLEEAKVHLRQPTNKKNIVALTFDDSYKEFYTVVMPVAQNYNLPITIFIAVGPLQTGSPLLVDLLIYAVHNTTRNILDLSSFGLKKYLLVTVYEKEEAIYEINDQLKDMDAKKQDKMIKDIFRKLHVDFDITKQSSTVLNWSDVKKMHKNGIFIGSHSITHPNLAAIPIEKAEEEICKSKQQIEEKIGSKIAFFSYPYGAERNYNYRIMELVKSCGYQGAVTLCSNDTNNIDEFNIPRIQVSLSMVAGPMKKFSKSIFESEISGFSKYLFLRFLKSHRKRVTQYSTY